MKEKEFWDLFENDNIACLCNRENITRFLNRCERNGYSWNGGTGSLATDLNPFEYDSTLHELVFLFGSEYSKKKILVYCTRDCGYDFIAYKAIEWDKDDTIYPTITVQVDGKKTIATMKKDGKVVNKAIARCHPKDKFNYKEGVKTAIGRLLKDESMFDEEQEPGNVNNEQKYDIQIGDRVRFKTWEQMEKEFGVDCEGDIKCNFCFTEQMSYLCGTCATVKCFGESYSGMSCINLTDFETSDCRKWTYSLDMVEFVYRPVKRKAKIGEYVKVIGWNGLHYFYNNEIVRVEAYCSDGFINCRSIKSGLRQNLLSEDYIVLEGYKPEVCE